MREPIRIEGIVTARRADNTPLIAKALQYADTGGEEILPGLIAYVPEGLIPEVVRANPKHLENFHATVLGYRVHGMLSVPIKHGVEFSVPLVTPLLHPERTAQWYTQHLAERGQTIEAMLDQVETQECVAIGYCTGKSAFQRWQFSRAVLAHPQRYGLLDDEQSRRQRQIRFSDVSDIAIRITTRDDDFLVATDAYRTASDWIVSTLGGPLYECFITQAEREERELLAQQARERENQETEGALTSAQAPSFALQL